jgi:multidrug efflux pump
VRRGYRGNTAGDVYFTIGLVTIIGLAAKDAILIIEFARTLRAQGKPLIESAIEASYLRFRPILMTGFAFVFGVAPMVVASGASSKSQQALGTGVMGGMIAVVVLALLMVPMFYVVVQRLFGRKSPSGEGPDESSVPRETADTLS